MPAPKPTAEHVRDGTYQPCRHDDRADAHFPDGPPSMPDGLDPQAKWLWKLVEDNVPHKVLSPADSAMLLYVCRWWSIWREYDRQIDEGENDPYKMMIQAATAGKKVVEGLAKFGLSPRDRATLKIPSGGEPQEDAFTKLLRARGGN